MKTQSTQSFSAKALLQSDNLLLTLSVVCVLAALGLWLALTPHGIYGKADAVGYAVCHRIEVRSFLFPDGRQIPMCARCSGTFVGVIVGLAAPGLLFRKNRAAKLPALPVMIVLVGFTAWWAFDGTNSFAHLLPDTVPRLYTPTNFLRVTTGMFHGITMGSLVLPMVNAVIWDAPRREHSLDKAWHVIVLIVIGAVLMLMMYSQIPAFLYPLALVSAVGAIAILTAVNTILLTAIFRRENLARNFRDALPLILFGAAVTLTMIGAIDAIRFATFGTWDGFTF